MVDTVRPATRLISGSCSGEIFIHSAGWCKICLLTLLQVWIACHNSTCFFSEPLVTGCFNNVRAMYMFRHLAVHFQQTWPGERGLLSPAWDLLTRWEIAVPVNHRPATPRLLVDSLITMSLQWGWQRWAGLTALAFYGGMRVGEPLQATRCWLGASTIRGLNPKCCFWRSSRRNLDGEDEAEFSTARLLRRW